MTATVPAPRPQTTRPAPPKKWRVLTIELIALAIVLLCLSAIEIKWERLAQFPENFVTYTGLMLRGALNNPFEEPYAEYWLTSLEFMGQSLAMAWVGTVIGALLSFPIGFLAASNTAPRWIVVPTRQVLNAIRTVPDVIFAIVIMVPIFGLGPLPGALALGVGSIGTLGKLTSEVIEGIDTGPVESVRSSGANPLQVMRWAILPQVMPEVIAFWLYRFEVNIRAGAILGVVGAGGIGSLLSRVFDQRDWDRIGIALIVIILVTMIVDAISGAVRHRIIAGAPTGSAGAVV